MSKKKIFYRYNPHTLNYERVYPDIKSRIFVFLRHLISGILVGGGGLIIFFMFFGSPQEKALEKENKILRTQNDVLSKRIDQAFKILEPIRERDDYMYRAIYQADPIASSIRNSGVRADNYYNELANISNSELILQSEKKMDILEKQLYIQSNSLDEIQQMIISQEDRIRHTPSIQPVANKNLKRMASGYGVRIDPIYKIPKHHDGMDFSADVGTPIFATADGVVTVATKAVTGYGHHIDIDHGYNMMTRYAHMSEFNVKVGDHVKRGDIIGKVGSTGKSTGPHLHYEVRVKGQPQNPAYYYFGDLTPEEFDLMLETAANMGQVMD